MAILFHDTNLKCPVCHQEVMYVRQVSTYSKNTPNDANGWYPDERFQHDQIVCAHCNAVVRDFDPGSKEHIGK